MHLAYSWQESLEARVGMVIMQGRGKWNVDQPRVARIIAYLLTHQAKIAAMPKGQVAFSFAGEGGLTAEVIEKEDLSQMRS